MDAGGRYVLLCTGVDLTPEQRDQAIGALRQAFVGCGYTDPRIDVIGQAQLIGVLGPFPSLCPALNGNGLGYFDTLRTWATQDQMQYKFKHLGPRVKFISIYGDFGDSVGETIYMNAPALADEQIGEIMGE